MNPNSPDSLMQVEFIAEVLCFYCTYNFAGVFSLWIIFSYEGKCQPMINANNNRKCFDFDNCRRPENPTKISHNLTWLLIQ